MRAKKAGYLDTWEIIRREAGCEHLEKPHTIHPLGMLSKEYPDGTKKLKALIDASRTETGKQNSVNSHCENPRTRYCTILMVMLAMKKHESFYGADFEDCFNQIPMSKWSMRFCGIRFPGVLYAYRVGSQCHSVIIFYTDIPFFF
jgi:hypothetical protein